MSRPAWEPLPDEDSVLLDYARRLDKFRAGRRAVRLSLSRLRPHNRREQHLRIAASTFDLLLSKFDGALFRLHDSDMVVVCNGASVADMDDCVLRLRYMFGDDPLFQDEEERGGAAGVADPFCTWYDLGKDYPAFLAAAEANAEARRDAELAAAAAEASEAGNKAEAASRPRAPLDAAGLAALIAALRNADLSGLLRRQSVCAVVGSEKPHVLFNEIYFSVAELAGLLSPDHDLIANAPLFQELCRHLDRRMMSLLARRDDPLLDRAFGLNLAVETVLSPAFLQFDAALNGASRRTIVVELQAIDVMADFGAFLFAREFLRDRGYRLCLDGVTCISLPTVKPEAFGVDLVKVLWNGEIPDRVNPDDAANLRAALQDLLPDRVIMSRCDSEEALDFGRGMGITLFQGRQVDYLLKDRATLQDTVSALAEARGRQRAAERSLDRVS